MEKVDSSSLSGSTSHDRQMKIFCIFVGLLVVAPGFLSAGDPLEFKLKGFGVGAAKSDLSEQLKKAKKSGELSVDSAGIEVYDVEDGSSPPAKITITFLDGKAVRIVGEYAAAEVERIGGLDSLLERVTEKLGRPSGPVVRHRLVGDTMVLLAASWRKPLQSRIFILGCERIGEKVSTTLVLADLSNELENRRKKSTSAGF